MTDIELPELSEPPKDDNCLIWLIEDEGPPSHAEKPDPVYAETFCGKLPDMLIDFWLEHGWGGWQRGQFWLCDPAVLQPVVDIIFQNDPEMRARTIIPIGYEAFGKFYCWCPDEKEFLDVYFFLEYVRPHTYTTVMPIPGITTEPYTPSEMAFFTGYILGLAQESFEPIENGLDTDDMMSDALAALGELGPGEVYGYVPALALGGEERVENLRKLPVGEHLAFLATLQSFTLYAYTPPAEGEGGFGSIDPVRRIGAAQE